MHSLRADSFAIKWARVGWLLSYKLFNNTTKPMPEYISLCQLGRAMFFWPVLYALASLAMVTPIIVFAGVFMNDGMWGVWYAASIPVGLSAIFLVAMLLVGGAGYLKENVLPGETWYEREERRNRGDYNGYEIFKEYVKTRKSKFCPMINIKED